jgi:ABC-type antimicrobial peptide transport system permease subunit
VFYRQPGFTHGSLSYPDYQDLVEDSRAVFTDVSATRLVMNPMIDPVVLAAAGLLTVVVGLVLLIACANLAGFLLAQGQERRREIAIRLALGARRGSLVRQLLTETVALAICGGILGAVISWFALNALATADLPLPFPITLDLAPDARVIGFTALVSLAAGILFGLAPALRSTRADITPVLKDENAGGGPRQRLALRDVLVCAGRGVSRASRWRRPFRAQFRGTSEYRSRIRQ